MGWNHQLELDETDFGDFEGFPENSSGWSLGWCHIMTPAFLSRSPPPMGLPCWLSFWVANIAGWIMDPDWVDVVPIETGDVIPSSYVS